jgi:hypothetical protein
MSLARYDRPRNEPFYWWGQTERASSPPRLRDLVGYGMLTAPEAALLVELFDRGASLFVISLKSGAGKSTLLNAIAAESSGRDRYYLRGCYETFDMVNMADPSSACLLANEISPHLPIYLWGTAVETFFRSALEGFQIASTAHARSVAEFVHRLTIAPLHVPTDVIAAPKIIATLADALPDPAIRHSLMSIATLAPGDRPGSIRTRILAPGSAPALDDALAIATDWLCEAGLRADDLDRAVDQAVRRLAPASG